MWKLYVHGREGVAIKTTVGLLGRLVSEDNRALRTGLVEYRDVDKTPQGRSRVLHFEGGSCSGYRDISDNEANVFRKNEGFRHELEVRAVTYERRYPEHADAAAAFSLLDRGHPVIIPRGENIPVDLSRLIQQIRVSSGFPPWAIASLQKTVDAAGIPVEVKASTLLDRPSDTLISPLRG